MEINNFKNSLKVKTKSIKPGLDVNSLFSELGLLNIPNDLQVNVSNDNKYLDLRLSGDSDSDTHHLLFQLPLHENTFSNSKSRSDYQDLINRYYIYTKEYLDEIKDYALQERAFLQEKFPGLVFVIKIRVKSFESYINKLEHNIEIGKSPYINDIIAERIVISEYKNCRSEKVLSHVCDDVAKALYDFRINTNFRMKKNINDSPSNSDKYYITKDYITYPKSNGYQSLHIQMENKNNSDFNYETQIRTFYMESQSKSSNEIAHNIYKPRLLNDLSANRVPSYSVIAPFDDSCGNPIIYDIPFKDRFYHYYNTSLNNHDLNRSKRTLPITYDNYKKELYQIENLLGLSFKDLRTRIRHSSILNSKQKEEETHCL